MLHKLHHFRSLEKMAKLRVFPQIWAPPVFFCLPKHMYCIPGSIIYQSRPTKNLHHDCVRRHWLHQMAPLGPILDLLKILEGATEGFEISNFAQRCNSTSSTNWPNRFFWNFLTRLLLWYQPFCSGYENGSANAALTLLYRRVPHNPIVPIWAWEAHVKKTSARPN